MKRERSDARAHDGCDVEEGACGVDGGLEVLCQPSIAPKSCEEPLDGPSAGVNSEADLIGVLAHDLEPTIKVALATFSPAYPLSAKTRWMNGKMRREARRSGPPPSRSWMLAGCGSSTRPRPSVSTSAWRLRPLIFFPAS